MIDSETLERIKNTIFYLEKYNTIQTSWQTYVLGIFILLTCASLIYMMVGIKKNRKAIFFIMTGITFVLGILVSPNIIQEARRTKALKEDYESPCIMQTEGKLVKKEVFNRGVEELYLSTDDNSYREISGANSIGNLIIGLNYRITYLKKSKYFIDIEVIDPHEFKEDCWITTSELKLFGDEFYPITSWKQIDEIADDYILNYYRNTDLSSYEKYLEKSKIVYTYYREDINQYVIFISFPEFEEKNIYMMFDPETGKPVYFEENW